MLPFRNYIQYWEGWGSIVLWSGELWQPVWDPPHSQLLLLQKLLKDEHHRRIGKGDTSSLSKIFLAKYRLYFIDCIFLFNLIILCQVRTSVTDDQPSTLHSRHQTTKLPQIPNTIAWFVCTWSAPATWCTWSPVTGHLRITCAHLLWSSHLLRWTTLCCEIPVGGGSCVNCVTLTISCKDLICGGRGELE